MKSKHLDSNILNLNPVSLAFRGEQTELESSFADYYFDKNLLHLRRCHYISLFFYFSSTLIDLAFFKSVLVPFLSIRYGVVSPCFILGLIITYFPVYRKIWQQLSCIYVLVTGCSFIAFVALAPKPIGYTYYAGIMVCMMFGYAFIRERFLWASAAGCTLTVLFIGVSMIIHMPATPLLIFGFYLFMVNLLGMLIAYSYEIQSRKDYLLTHLLTLEKKKVDALVTGLEKKVQSRTQELQLSNKELTREISQHKTTELALRASEERYRSLQSNIPLGLYRIAKGRLISVNPAMVNMFHFNTEKQLLEKPAKAYFCDLKVFRNLLRQLREHDRIINAEVGLRRADGSKLIGLINVTRLASNDKAGFFYDGTIEDITARKIMAEEKESLAMQLRQAYKMEAIGNLAGGIAHDFNNILMSAMGYTELAIEEAKKDSRLEVHLQELYNAWKRARDLVQQILAFARKSDEAVRPLQVSLIAKEVLKFIRSSIPSTIEIRQNIKSASLILGNAIQMHQIFMNLCTNAAHAMEISGGTLTVELVDAVIESNAPLSESGLKPGEYIKLSVSDTGTGIPEDIIDSIFDPYFTTKSPGEGTGLGLSTVHGIVNSYGGKITVNSTVGKGSIFTIYLPITKKQRDYQPYERTTPLRGSEKILFVDDEAAIARLGHQILEKLGYRVRSYTSSLEALARFQENPTDFDLVVTDMTMPHMTGEQLAKEIRQFRPDIPIILCTGFNKKLLDTTDPPKHVSVVMNKPVSKQDLAKTVREVIDNNKQAYYERIEDM